MLRIHSKVMTAYGEGVLVSVETPHNGLYVGYENATCVVWFGSESPGVHRLGKDTGRWISKEMSYRELIEYNKDLVREEKIDDILR